MATKPRNTRQRITADVLNKYSEAQLDKYIEQMGKSANRHLTALEKEGASSGSKAYSYVQGLAHDKAYASHTEKPRFRTTTTGESFQQKKAHAAEIQRFFSAKTHTVKGVERAYEKSYKTFVRNRAKQAAEEKKGIGNASKADIMREAERIRGKVTASDFNQAWGSFNSDQYEKAKQISEIVADLIEEGYSGSDIGRAIDEYGTGRAESEYMELIDAGFYGEDNPFEEEGLFD